MKTITLKTARLLYKLFGFAKLENAWSKNDLRSDIDPKRLSETQDVEISVADLSWLAQRLNAAIPAPVPAFTMQEPVKPEGKEPAADAGDNIKAIWNDAQRQYAADMSTYQNSKKQAADAVVAHKAFIDTLIAIEKELGLFDSLQAEVDKAREALEEAG